MTVTVRLEPLPPKTMPLSGTSVGSDELALTVSAAAGVVVSPMVNPATALVFNAIVWSAMRLTVGGPLVTVSVKLLVEASAISISRAFHQRSSRPAATIRSTTR